MNTKSIAERLREERTRLGLTQERFGAEGGVGKLAQLNYEKGERSPDAMYLSAISKAGVDVLYVITGNRMVPPPTTDEQVLLAAYRVLDVRGRAAALGAVTGLSAQPQPAGPSHNSQVVVGGSNNIQIGQVHAKTPAKKKVKR